MGARSTANGVVVRSDVLRVGIVGAGLIGTVHARAAGAVVDTVVTSRSASSVLPCAPPWTDVSCVTSSLDDAIARCDVVHVCLPNTLHAEAAVRAIDAGRHVVCEKPLTTELASSQRLATAARRAGVVATVPFVYRFHPMARELRARLAGADGRVTLITGTYLQDWLVDPDNDNWRLHPASGGPSRAFAGIGSHWFDLMEHVTGTRVDASPRSSTRSPDESAARRTA